MTKPIRATRGNLLPGTIWQNAAGTECIRIDASTGVALKFFSTGMPLAKVLYVSDFLKSDIWYQVQPIKEPTT